MKTLLVVAVLALTGVAGCEKPQSSSAGEMRNEPVVLPAIPADPPKISNQAMLLVNTYVAKSRGWPVEAYTLGYAGTKDGLLLVTVALREETDEANDVLGAKKSFFVFVDEKAEKIVREGHFQ